MCRKFAEHALFSHSNRPVDSPGGIPARNEKGERLLIFLGVIDILQSYRMIKKFEHTFKSVFTDGDTVSVHRPGFYAQRFLDFMANKVFRKIPSRKLPPAACIATRSACAVLVY